MANNGLSNAGLKKRNAKIFKNIENRLASDDEGAFIAAADKLKTFVSKKEAYYAEARPVIVNMCKSARACLTRLAKSDAPFHCGRPIPHGLRARAAAYVRLIETVLQFASTFENDEVRRRDDLKDLFHSVTTVPLQSSDTEPKEQKENTELQETNPTEETSNDADTSRGGSRASSSLAIPLPEPSSDQHKEPTNKTTQSPPVPSTPIVDMAEAKSTRSPVPDANTSTAHCPSNRTVEASAATAEHLSPTPLSVIGRPVTVRMTTTREPSVGAPITPISPTTPLNASAAEPASSAKAPLTKAPAKARKLKLKRTVPVDASLIEADLNWHSSKQREFSETRASASPATPTIEGITSGSAGVKSSAPIANTDVVAVGTDESSTKHVPDAVPSSETSYPRNEASATLMSPAPVDTDINMSGSISAQMDQPKLETSGDVPRSAQEDVNMIDTDIATTDNAGTKEDSATSILIGAADRVLQEEPKNRDSSFPSPPRRRTDSKAGESSDSILDVGQSEDKPEIGVSKLSAVIFACIDFGRDVGNTLSLQYTLTPAQSELLSLWQTREQHEWDVSSSICISLASYKATDAVLAGFKIENRNDDVTSKLMSGLTPSWPTNARLSANLGSSRIFLAPPLQVTREGFVDISSCVNGLHGEVSLDHAGDMSEYLFALVVHPPTISQLQELEERRTKTRKFRGFLDNLRITTVDVFG